jgi:uncharacterized protein (DUF488 family)
VTRHTHSETSPGRASLEVFTIGHSTRSSEELLRLLKAHGVEQVVDVRSIPRSRRHPQFEKEALAAALDAEGVAYTHLKELGGFRRARPDSPNAGLRHPSFRGYADHMLTGEFAAGLERLLELASSRTTAVLCAEGDPMRCHRRLLSDSLVARGVRVRHITSARRAYEHTLTGEAEIDEGRVTYPERETPLF